MNWSEQAVLVTGGTGSFGKKFVEIMLKEYRPKRLVIFSRDELKQHDMRASGLDHPSLRYFIGDVRDAGAAGAGFRRSHDRGSRRCAEAGAGLRVQPVRGHSDQHHGRPQCD